MHRSATGFLLSDLIHGVRLQIPAGGSSVIVETRHAFTYSEQHSMGQQVIFTKFLHRLLAFKSSESCFQ